MLTVSTAVSIGTLGLQKGINISLLKSASKALYQKNDTVPKKHVNFVAGTTAAVLHAATKIPLGVKNVYKDASVTLTAVAMTKALSNTDLPTPAKTFLIFGTAGGVLALQNPAFQNPKLAFVLTGFYAGSKIADKAIPALENFATYQVSCLQRNKAKIKS